MAASTGSQPSRQEKRHVLAGQTDLGKTSMGKEEGGWGHSLLLSRMRELVRPASLLLLSVVRTARKARDFLDWKRVLSTKAATNANQRKVWQAL